MREGKPGRAWKVGARGHAWWVSHNWGEGAPEAVDWTGVKAWKSLRGVGVCGGWHELRSCAV